MMVKLITALILTDGLNIWQFFGIISLKGMILSIRINPIYLNLNNSYKAIHYHVFRDKTRQLKQQKCDGEGVYFRLGGDSEEEIFYLGSIPPGARAEEAMDYIYADLERFELGVSLFYGPSGKNEIFYGSLLTGLGTYLYITHNYVLHLL